MDGAKGARKSTNKSFKRRHAVEKITRENVSNFASGDQDDFKYMLKEMSDYQEENTHTSGGPHGREPAQAVDAGAQHTKKKRRKKRLTSSLRTLEAIREVAKGISNKSASVQAEWLGQKYSKWTGDASLEHTGIKADSIIELAHHGSCLEPALISAFPDWKSTFCKSSVNTQPGNPGLLFISGAAISACDMIKVCPRLNKLRKIAKLFAKHIKQSEQEDLLRDTVVGCGTGTPHRIHALIDKGALHLDELKLIVLDVRIDAKQMVTLLDAQDIQRDFWTLWDKHLRPLVERGVARVALTTLEPLH